MGKLPLLICPCFHSCFYQALIDQTEQEAEAIRQAELEKEKEREALQKKAKDKKDKKGRKSPGKGSPSKTETPPPRMYCLVSSFFSRVSVRARFFALARRSNSRPIITGKATKGWFSCDRPDRFYRIDRLQILRRS